MTVRVDVPSVCCWEAGGRYTEAKPGASSAAQGRRRPREPPFLQQAATPASSISSSSTVELGPASRRRLPNSSSRASASSTPAKANSRRVRGGNGEPWAGRANRRQAPPRFLLVVPSTTPARRILVGGRGSRRGVQGRGWPLDRPSALSASRHSTVATSSKNHEPHGESSSAQDDRHALWVVKILATPTGTSGSRTTAAGADIPRSSTDPSVAEARPQALQQAGADDLP